MSQLGIPAPDAGLMLLESTGAATRPVALAPATVEALRCIDAYALARTPVVFVGETGTGKSYFARLLHERSGRPGPFEDITAGELTSAFAEDKLMGHERGAFTGAVGRRLGLIAAAADGTLMIDDFHLLRLSVQYLLMRLFDRRLYRRAGADRDLTMQCRLVVGLGVEPDELVKRGRLVRDLRFRLRDCIVRIPRLEDRREEIEAFAQLFLAEAPVETGVPGVAARFGPGVIASLELATWPGNVRQLRNAIEAAYLHARRGDTIEFDHLPAQVSPRFDRRADKAAKLRLVQWALWRTKGRVAPAAELIGADRKTVAAVRRELGRARPEKRSGGSQG